MKLNLAHRRALTGIAVLFLALGASAASLAAPAGAAGRATPKAVPPWEPDPGSVGGLVFYNSAGQVVTGGSTSASPIAAYVQGTATLRSGDTRATLFGYLPVKGEPTGQWSGEELGSSTAYPGTGAPASLSGASLPFETGASGDESVAELASDFPNEDSSSDGYSGIYELRLKTSSTGEGLTTSYDSADIEITGDSWSVVYSKGETTASLTVSPGSLAYHGSSVRLTATVSPATATGSVQFLDGSRVLHTSALSGGKASFTTSSLADGRHSLAARYVPSGSTPKTAATSATHLLQVAARPTKTKLSVSKHSVKAGATVTLTARETPAVRGSFTFYDGAKKIAVVAAAKGAAHHSYRTHSAGTQRFKATFKPSTPANDKASSSSVVAVSVKGRK